MYLKSFKVLFIVATTLLLSLYSQEDNQLIDLIGWELEIYSAHIFNDIVDHDKTDALVQEKRYDFNQTGNSGSKPKLSPEKLNFYANIYMEQTPKIVNTIEFQNAIMDESLFNSLFPTAPSQKPPKEAFTEEEIKFIKENFIPKEESRIITDIGNYVPPKVQDLMKELRNQAPPPPMQTDPTMNNLQVSESGLLLPQDPPPANDPPSLILGPEAQLQTQAAQEQINRGQYKDRPFDERFVNLNEAHITDDAFKQRIYQKLRNNFKHLPDQYKRRIMRYRHLDFPWRNEFLRSHRIVPFIKKELSDLGLFLKYDRSTMELVFDDSKNEDGMFKYIPKSLDEFSQVINKVGKISFRIERSVKSPGNNLEAKVAGSHFHITFNNKIDFYQLKAVMEQFKLDNALTIYEENINDEIPREDRKILDLYNTELTSKGNVRKVGGRGDYQNQRRYEIRESTMSYKELINYLQSFFNSDGSLNISAYRKIIEKNHDRLSKVETFAEFRKIDNFYKNVYIFEAADIKKDPILFKKGLEILKKDPTLSLDDKFTWLIQFVDEYPLLWGKESIKQEIEEFTEFIFKGRNLNNIDQVNLDRFSRSHLYILENI